VYFLNEDSLVYELMEPTTVNKVFYKRFNLIEQVKESEVFGIIVGSLSMKNLNSLLEELKTTLKLQNKKYYQLLLGKITDEKLANFVEYIDCFVLIACPFSDFYNKKALMKPLVSPLDIKIAFDPNYSWDMTYSFDINYIVKEKKSLKLDLNNGKSIQEENKDDNMKDYAYNEKLQALRLLE